MWDDSDEEISDLKIQGKTWKKLEKNMKSIGFLEGASEGKKLSWQDGFNLGYSYGFALGKHLGIVKGEKSIESDLELSLNNKFEFDEQSVDNTSSSVCTICINEKTPKPSEKNQFKKFEDLVLAQKSVNDSILNKFEQFVSK